MISDKRVLQLVGLSAILLGTQCGMNDQKDTSRQQEQPVAGPSQPAATAVATDSAGKVPEADTARPAAAPVSASGFAAYPLKGVDSAIKTFKKKYSKEEQYVILALNRLDAGHISRADTLVIPGTVQTDLMSYSPYPKEVAAISDIPKIIFFSYPIQAFGAYENGRLVYWGPTSMGSKIHPTPAGLHFTNWKGRQIISTVNDEWKLNWNFNIANKEGVGWHEYDLPGYPASHSCLRLLADQAKWLYDWGQQWILDKKGTLLANGTPVIVFGEYPWGQRRPWKNLLDDANANTITEQDITEQVKPYLEKIKTEQERRAQVEGSRGATVAAATDSAAAK